MPVPGASDDELAAARAPTAPVHIAAAAVKPAAGGQLPNGAGGTTAAANADELRRQLVSWALPPCPFILCSMSRTMIV